MAKNISTLNKVSMSMSYIHVHCSHSSRPIRDKEIREKERKQTKKGIEGRT